MTTQEKIEKAAEEYMGGRDPLGSNMVVAVHRGFKAGMTAGIELGHKRAKVLVDALEIYAAHEDAGHPYAAEALAKYREEK